VPTIVAFIYPRPRDPRSLHPFPPRRSSDLNRHNILAQLEQADLLIGAVLLPGAKAPNLVRREDLKRMKQGAVVVDVAVDQGDVQDRKSTRLNSSHVKISYAVFCLKKKNEPS